MPIDRSEPHSVDRPNDRSAIGRREAGGGLSRRQVLHGSALTLAAVAAGRAGAEETDASQSTAGDPKASVVPLSEAAREARKQAAGGLHHSALFVADVDRTIAFYAEAFGLNVAYRFGSSTGRTDDGTRYEWPVGPAFLDCGNGSYLELFAAGEMPAHGPDAPLNHFALRVADCRAAYQRAVRAGAAEHRVPLPGGVWNGMPMAIDPAPDDGVGFVIAMVRGPDDELIELFESAEI